MRCPFCASQDTQVKDSRVAEDGSYIKRRRFCTECGSEVSATAKFCPNCGNKM